MRLLPKHEPVIPGLETAGLCRPAQSIGGDYYDYLTLASGSFVLAIGDVAGKGVPAALLMSNLQAALRGLAVSSTLDVPALTAQLNQLVYDSTPSNRFITFLTASMSPPRAGGSAAPLGTIRPRCCAQAAEKWNGSVPRGLAWA